MKCCVPKYLFCFLKSLILYYRSVYHRVPVSALPEKFEQYFEGVTVSQTTQHRLYKVSQDKNLPRGSDLTLELMRLAKFLKRRLRECLRERRNISRK